MRILIIDDDLALLRSLDLVLTARGHSVWTFDDPLRACSFLEKGAPVNVLILDYAMPGRNADEVLRQIRGKLPAACKVILISGHTFEAERLDRDSLGIQVFLPKPLDLEELCSVLDGVPLRGEQL